MGEESVGITLVAKDMASGAISNVRKELQSLGGVGGIASAGIGAVGKVASGVEGALSHLKSTIGGLISGPLGMLGLGAGVFTLAGALKSGIDTASGMALSIEKLTGLTGESAEAMSGLLAVTGKFNISADALGTIVGFAEKTLGKLATTAPVSAAKVDAAQQAVTKAQEALNVSTLKLQELEAKGKASASALASARNAVTNATVTLHDAETKLATAEDAGSIASSKLAALDKQYGLSLIDAQGHVVDFSTELAQVSDYYISNAAESSKAALAAQLFGRGYAVLIPVLKLGSAGIKELEQTAASLGLTLTEQNVTDLQAYQEAMRDTGDAVGGLQLQLSLALVPAIEDVAKAATGFIANNRQGIVTFFQTLIADSRTAAAFITGTIVPDLESLAGAAIGFWNAIPPQLRDLIVKGFVADKAIKFLFGFDPATTIGSIISTAISKGLGNAIGNAAGGVAGGLLARGSSPANPLWVQMVGGGGIPGGPAGAAEDAAAGGGALAAGALATGIAAILGAYWLPQFLANENDRGAQGAPVKGANGTYGTLSWQQLGMTGLGNVAANVGITRPTSSGGTGGNVGSDQYPTSGPSSSGGTGGLVGSDQYSNLGGAAKALAAALQQATGWVGTWSSALQKSEREQSGALFGKPSAKQGTAADTLVKYLQSVSSAYFKTPQSVDQLNRDISTLQRDQTAAVKAGNSTLASKLGEDVSALEALKAKVAALKLSVTVNATTNVTQRSVQQGSYYSAHYVAQVHAE